MSEEDTIQVYNTYNSQIENVPISELKPISLGQIQIFSELCVESEGAWIPFNLETTFEHVFKMRRFPKARVWNGKEWIPIGLREHVLGIVNLIGEADE